PRTLAVGHAATGGRGGQGIRTLRGLCARGADVFRQTRGALHRRRRPIVPRPDARQTSWPARRAGHDIRLGEPYFHDFSRGAAQALSRNARRGWWSLAPAACATCILGGAALR